MTVYRASRRDFLRLAGALTAAVTGASLLAACQTTAPTASPTTAPAVKATAPAKSDTPAGAKPAATSAPASAAKAGEPKRGGEITFAINTRLNTMDPNRVDSLQLASVNKLVCRGLTHFDKDGSPIPDLAERWEVSPDGLAWTFTLKQGVKFHDGTPFNAQAVKINIDRLLDPANKMPRRAQIAMVGSVDALSDHSVRFNLPKPFAGLTEQLAYYSTAFVSPAALDKWGNDDVALHPIGTGPYKVDSYMANERIVLVRDPEYKGTGGYLDKITAINTPEDSARLAALESGQADIISNVPPQSIPNITSNSRLQFVKAPSSRTLFIGMNMFREEFKDKRVRKALNHAVDKDAIVKNILQDLGRVSESPWANSVWGFAKQPPYTYDPARAKALLAEAGWTPGPDGIVQRNGQKLSVPFLVGEGRYLRDVATAEAVQSYLKQVGVDAQLRRVDGQTVFDMMRRPSARTAEAETALTLFALGVGAGVATYADFFNSYGGKFENAGSLAAFYQNPEVDQLIPDAASALDEQKRRELYRRMQEIIWDDAPWIFLHYLDQTGGARANLQGVVVNPLEFWMLEQAWLA